jgi:hypothetical protein
VVDRRWLKSLWAQNIFLLPLQKNFAIVEKDLESEESDGQEMDELCFESCAKFGEIMDIEVIEEHTRKCVDKNSIIETEKVDHKQQLSAFFNANGLQKMLTRRFYFLLPPMK